jgi:hypothetical protein
MRPSDEKKLLLQVLRQLESPSRNVLLAEWFLPAGWVVSVVAFAAVFQFGERINPGLLAAMFAVFGVVIGIAFFAREYAKQEPVMRPHIDRESILRRLAELET